MLDLMAHDRLADIRRKVLGGKFRGMDPDNHELVWKPLTKPAQLRDIMEAVNSAEGPELEEHEFSSKLLQRQRMRRIQPFKSWGELGRAQLFTKIGHR
jgi:hypothetical protein